MKRVLLKNMIKESVLNEFRLEKDVRQKIDEFGQLSEKIGELKDTLNRFKKRYKGLEDELRPLLSDIEDLQVQSMKTNKYLVQIKRKGYERENYKYKQVFQESLTKVNSHTRKILEEMLQSTKTVSKIASKLDVQKIDEISFKDIIRKVKSMFSSLSRKVKKGEKHLKKFNRFLQKIS